MTLQEGSAYVIWLKDEGMTVIRRIFRAGPRIRLQPIDPTRKPEYTDPHNIRIEAKLLTRLRTWF